MRRLSEKQLQCLRDIRDDNEPTDLADFNGPFGWHNRERTITSLWDRKLVDGDGITAAGRDACA